ncbi:hypothetical protein RCL1_003621 [Eukaryota sp. TZLM3-RCL]
MILFNRSVVIKGSSYELVIFRSESVEDPLSQACISLYHHVLPNISKSLARQVLSHHNALTAALFDPHHGNSTETSDKYLLRNLLVSNPSSSFHQDSDDISSHSLSDSDEKEEEESEEEESSSNEEGEEDEKESSDDDVTTIKSRICAAVTIESSVSTHKASINSTCHSEIIHQLSLIGVRLSKQSNGLAQYLMEIILNPEKSFLPQLYPPFDVFLTYSDLEAVSFFSKFGFTKDVILTWPYQSIGDDWDDCILMVKYSSKKSGSVENGGNFDWSQEVKNWTNSRINSYSSDLQLIHKLTAKISDLESIILQKDQEIAKLKNQKVESNPRFLQLSFSKPLNSKHVEYSFMEREITTCDHVIMMTCVFDCLNHPNRAHIINSISSFKASLLMWVVVDLNKIEEIFTTGYCSEIVAFLNIHDVMAVKNELINQNNDCFYLCRGYSAISRDSSLLFTRANTLDFFSPVLAFKIQSK